MKTKKLFKLVYESEDIKLYIKPDKTEIASTKEKKQNLFLKLLRRKRNL